MKSKSRTLPTTKRQFALAVAGALLLSPRSCPRLQQSQTQFVYQHRPAFVTSKHVPILTPWNTGNPICPVRVHLHDVEAPSRPSTAHTKSHNNKPEIKIIPSKTDTQSLRRAAEFMVDAYWLNSPTSLIANETIIDGRDDTSAGRFISESLPFDRVRDNLAEIQLHDFIGRYHSKRKSRLLHSRLLIAVDASSKELGGITAPEILGLVGMEVRLCDGESQVLHSTQKSEEIILESIVNNIVKNRMSQLPHCVPKLVDELLPPQFNAVCVLSNLAVSPKARRRGLAMKLCNEVERVASAYCGCDEIFLEVERDNAAARKLYEKLGYVEHCLADAPAKRVNLATGTFRHITSPTLVMKKNATLPSHAVQQ